jgi:hypothetical protein
MEPRVSFATSHRKTPPHGNWNEAHEASFTRKTGAKSTSASWAYVLPVVLQSHSPVQPHCSAMLGLCADDSLVGSSQPVAAE